MNPFTRERRDPLWWDNRVPHSCSVWSRQKFLWIVMTQRTKIFYCSNMENKLKSCHNKTNWVNFVWMHDFWMLLKSDSISWRKTLQISHNFMQWLVVNTPFQEKKQHHNQKDGSKGTPKLGPCWKLHPVTRTVNMELRSEFGLWTETILTPGSEILMDQKKFVMNLNNNETEIPEVQLEEYASKLDAKDFACRSKAKAKPQRREPAGSSPRMVRVGRRIWTDIEPGKYSFSDYEVSKKVTYLVRHSQHVHREEDGAVHFWRIKENLQSQFPHSPHWSDGRWKECLAGGGGNKRRFQYCTNPSKTLVYFRALQGHSGRNIIDPSLQDNELIPNNIFQYIYHVGCAFNLHSIINSGLIPGGQSLSKRDRQYSVCLLILRTKVTRILMRSTRAYRVTHNTCRKHGRDIKTQYIGLTSILLLRKD